VAIRLSGSFLYAGTAGGVDFPFRGPGSCRLGTRSRPRGLGPPENLDVLAVTAVRRPAGIDSGAS